MNIYQSLIAVGTLTLTLSNGFCSDQPSAEIHYYPCKAQEIDHTRTH